MDNKHYYDEFANWYEKERHDGYHALIDELELDLVMPFARGADVLEVGCGTGLLLGPVSKVAKSAKGIDISPGMLKQARARDLDVYEGTAEKLPFEDESFDLVYSFKVLAHVQGIRDALREVMRVLRPGGHAVLEFYNKQSVRYVAKRLAKPGLISSRIDESAVYTRWDSPFSVKQMMPWDLEVVSTHGVRVATPAATVHRLPVLKDVFGTLERRLRDGKASRFGGFFVVTARKRKR